MSMCKTLAATILAGTMLFAGSAAAADKAPSGTASSKDGKAMELVQEWDKVFPRSDKVEYRKVTFRTRYGTVLAGDLYVPRDAKGKLAALHDGKRQCRKWQVSRVQATLFPDTVKWQRIVVRIG